MSDNKSEIEETFTVIYVGLGIVSIFCKENVIDNISLKTMVDEALHNTLVLEQLYIKENLQETPNDN